MIRKYKLTHYGLLAFCCLGLCSIGASAKKIYGRVEAISIVPENIEFQAKMDTGAFRSSLQAKHITFFTKGNEQWVRFTVTHGKVHKVLERPFLKETKVKKRLGDLDDQDEDDSRLTKRPVVVMDICLRGKRYLIETSLTDRSNFKYPMLIGRKAMERYQMIIDPSIQHTVSKACVIKDNSKTKS